MARNGIISWRRKSEKIDDFDLTPILDDVDEVAVHVLAVDDSLIDRKVIERLLKISSCKVTAVDSGRRALQFLGLDDDKTSAGFDGLKVDLIITDYCMPGMTGYELLKKIKESSTFKEIPVVIMSSENVLARIDRCLEEGAEDFIVKPVKLSDVKRLKDYTMTKDIAPGTNQARGINKRKSRETSELLSSVSPLSSPPTAISSPATAISSPATAISSPATAISSPATAISSPATTISSPPTTISSPTSLPPISLSSLSEQSLHTSLDSPTRRLKMTGCV